MSPASCTGYSEQILIDTDNNYRLDVTRRCEPESQVFEPSNERVPRVSRVDETTPKGAIR
jgi:hypothetical protein